MRWLAHPATKELEEYLTYSVDYRDRPCHCKCAIDETRYKILSGPARESIVGYIFSTARF